jgi:hypothetical protein
LERWRVAGIGPRYLKYPGRDVRYRLEHIEAWLAARVVASTSQSQDRWRIENDHQ